MEGLAGWDGVLRKRLDGGKDKADCVLCCGAGSMPSRDVEHELSASGDAYTVLDDDAPTPVHSIAKRTFIARSPGSTTFIEILAKLSCSVGFVTCIHLLPVNLVGLRNVPFGLNEQVSMLRQWRRIAGILRSVESLFGCNARLSTPYSGLLQCSIVVHGGVLHQTQELASNAVEKGRTSAEAQCRA